MKQSLKRCNDEIVLSKKSVSNIHFEKSFVERKVNFKTTYLKGYECEVYLNGIVLSSKKISSERNFETSISSDCPVIKLHFSLEGNYCYHCFKNDELVIDIPEGYCNLYYCPKLGGKEEFSNGHTKTLEVLFAVEYLQEILGQELTEQLKGIYEAIDKLKTHVFVDNNIPIPHKLQIQIKEILQCKYTGQVKKNYIKSRLTILLIDFLLANSKPGDKDVTTALPKADYLAILKVEEYCKQNLKKTLSIPQLAQIAGFNTTKLKQDFKKVYNTTIFKHITHLRMEKAEECIRNKGYSIAEASFEVGYSNPQHFTTAFKKNMGYLPGSLKK